MYETLYIQVSVCLYISELQSTALKPKRKKVVNAIPLDSKQDWVLKIIVRTVNFRNREIVEPQCIGLISAPIKL